MILLACTVLLLSLVCPCAAHATDEEEVELVNNSVTVGEATDEANEVIHVWGTLAEAKAVYGLSWTYVVVGFDSAGGYFLCYCEKSDGSRVYFGCYSL